MDTKPYYPQPPLVITINPLTKLLAILDGGGIIKVEGGIETDFLSLKSQKIQLTKEGGVLQMLKVKLQSIVNPRFFWSSITILVFLCAWLFIIAEDQRILNISLDAKLSATIAENKILESNLAKANKEIAARDEQIKLTLDKLEVAIKEKEVAIKEKEALEGKINEMTAQSSNVELPKIVVKTSPQ